MTGEQLPRARLRRRGFLNVAVWIVPLLAALVAGFLVFQRLQEQGPEIIIYFKDGGGLRVGQTPIKYRGVQIGEVSGVELSEDQQYVLVKARLRHTAASLAREGAVFWIVRPQVGWGNVTGLNTVISGPEIEVLPGQGEPTKLFTGLDRAPVAMGALGLKVILKAERPHSLKPNSPVYYRGVEVGIVQDLELAPNSTSADIHVLIWERYAPLVRTGSAFWNVSGASMKGGIFKGIEIDIESLRSVVAGGIEFASPPGAPRAPPGSVFFLHDSARPEWLAWNPKIPIAREAQK
jgi:paraquat-inducible protein B